MLTLVADRGMGVRKAHDAGGAPAQASESFGEDAKRA
jgi:hypothetical protein